MPKVTLEFNLPEEQSEFNLAVGGAKLFCALWAMSRYFRDQLKYNNKLKPNQIKMLEEVRNKFRDVLDANEVDLDNLA